MQINTMIRPSALLLAVAWVLGSCGSDDDPLAGKCEAVCQVEDKSNPCSAKQHLDKCIQDCRALSGEAARDGFKGNACGSCIADQFFYTGKKCKGDEICTFGGEKDTCQPAVGCSTDLEECWGAKQPKGINIPECTDLCIEVD